ncbi:MAG: PD-(D/E)XK nuclease domain-containing protein [Bacteroidota bacterium]|nr:PD-(D/E)XK nuclease domain-containing protein [Bacteroidota bacterium]
MAEAQLEEFNINQIELEVLLFQAGYLTIKESFRKGNRTTFKLKIPNKEVQIGLNEYLLRMFFAPGDNNLSLQNQLSNALYDSLTEKNPEILKDAYVAFFESVPHDWYRKNNIADYEGYYHCLFYASFAALGETVIPEDSTQKGDIDLTVITVDGIFIFEFKMKSNPQNALRQIKQKEYHKKYLNNGKDIFLIGIEFDKKIKNISNFEWEKCE